MTKFVSQKLSRSDLVQRAMSKPAAPRNVGGDNSVKCLYNCTSHTDYGRIGTIRAHQAFQSVRYPILPSITAAKPQGLGDRSYTEKEILHIRHHSLFTPRDFDVSPYFRVIKPTLEGDFDYKALVWEDEATAAAPATSGSTG